MYPNTKKELFLGQKPFAALRLTPRELVSKMAGCITDDLDVCDYGYDETDLHTGNADDDAAAIVCILREILADQIDGGGTDIGKILLEDLNVDGAQLTGFAEEDDWVKIVTFANGFACIRVLSTVGDDAFVPVYTALYIGADGMIHGFIPMYGNNVFAGTDVQLGAAGGNDADAWEALLAEYGVRCDSKDMFAYQKACFETYAKKYGIEGTDNDKDYRPGEYVDTLLELNEDYAEEDILSNVKLIG